MTGNEIIIVNRDGQLIYSLSRSITFTQANTAGQSLVFWFII